MPMKITIDHAPLANDTSDDSKLSTDEEEDGCQVSPGPEESVAESESSSDQSVHSIGTMPNIGYPTSDSNDCWTETNIIDPTDDIHPSRDLPNRQAPKPEVPVLKNVRRRPRRRIRRQADPDQHHVQPYYPIPHYPSPYPYQTYVSHGIPPGFMPPTYTQPPGFMPSTAYPSVLQKTYVAPPEFTQPTFTQPTFTPSSLWGLHRRKRICYYVPMRPGKKILDEESGFPCPAQALPEADRRLLGALPGLEQDPVHKQVDICAARCIPDIEGREIISLTVKDKSESIEHKDQRYESRWRHVKSRNLELDQLWTHVSNIGGLEADDRALVARVLKKVEKTCEKTFVHGKCLKPVTLVYSGKDSKDALKDIGKTAMFVSLPIFWLDFLPQHSFTQKSSGHPSRALLQTRSRLESTRRRETEQVITKLDSVQGVIHVPQIWALIINNHTMITYGPFEKSMLSESNIKTISYSEARLDEAKWSIRFENLEGNAFHLPLRLCGTWFGLIKHVSNSCPHYARGVVSHDLLQAGPWYRLDTKDGATVREENWSAMVREKKTKIMHLKLIMNEIPFYRQDNQASSDDRSKSNTLATDPESTIHENDLLNVAEVDLIMEAISHLNRRGTTKTPAVKTLASELEADIQRRGIHGDWCSKSEASAYSVLANDTSSNPDPTLSPSALSAKPESSFSSVTIPQREQGSSIPLLQPHFPSSSSGSMPGKTAESAPELDLEKLPEERYESVGRGKLETKQNPDSNSGVFEPEDYLEKLENPEQAEKITSQSQMEAAGPFHQSSCNNLLSKKCEDKVSMTGTPSKDPTENKEICGNGKTHIGPERILNTNSCDHQDNHPTKQLDANDNIGIEPVIRHKPIVSGTYSKGPVSLSRPQQESESSKDGRGDIFSRVSDRSTAEIRQRLMSLSVAGCNNTPTISQAVQHKLSHEGCPTDSMRDGFMTAKPVKIQPSGPAGNARRKSQHNLPEAKGHLRLDLTTQHESMTPRLKKLVKIALKELKENSQDVKKETHPKEKSTLVETAEIEQTPIFLWPVESARSEINQASIERENRMRAPVEGEVDTDAVERERQSNTAYYGEERMLHDILKEIHVKLEKPFRPLPRATSHAILYDILEDKTAPQISSLLQKIHENSQKDTNETDDDAGTISIRKAIHTYSQKIMNALVPEDCEDSVIAKYWGAVYRLLSESDRTTLRVSEDRLAALWALIYDIQREVQGEDEAKQPRYRIPPALPAAFQYLVMFLVLAGSPSHKFDASEKYEGCKASLTEAKKQLVSMIHTLDYGGPTGFEAVNCEALVAVVFSNLISRISPHSEYDLTEVYSEYTTKLQIMVRDKASVKVYHDIKLVREEVDAIKAILKEQEDVLSDFKAIIDGGRNEQSLTVRIIDRTLQSIEQRIEDFEELQSQADNARSLAVQSISIQKETNNKAILVFTVTTVTFLPLSFVTSYLGMNTSDLRTMNSGQTLFWAIGVPLTIVVLSLALLAAFYRPMRQRLSRIWRQEKKKIW